MIDGSALEGCGAIESRHRATRAISSLSLILLSFWRLLLPKRLAAEPQSSTQGPFPVKVWIKKKKKSIFYRIPFRRQFRCSKYNQRVRLYMEGLALVYTSLSEISPSATAPA